MAQPWLLYFRSNQTDPSEIPWEALQRPAPELGSYLIGSLQLFQLGEGARGLTFLELGRRHAHATGDLDFVETLALFIAEEHRHSAMLGRYLRSVGETTLTTHWVDGIFRSLRKLAGLECMVTVLVTAEILAVPYYRAVYRISSCPTLRAISRRILREEAQHLLFQASTLASLQRLRPEWWTRSARLAQHVLLAGMCVTVWAQHRRVLLGARMSFLSLVLTCRGLLRQFHRAARLEETRRRRGELLTRMGQPSSEPSSNAEYRTRSLADDGVKK